MPYSIPLFKKTLRVFLFVLLLALLFRDAFARQYPMLHYTIKNGLASNTIYDIYKDKKGYFWLGTDKGISRFNGISFENFTTADGLSDNECFFFRPDHYGRLWIGTYNGHLCFYKNGIFYNEKNAPWLKLPFTASQTAEIAINKDSSLTVFFRDDPRIVEIKNQQMKVLSSEITKKKYRDISRFLYAQKISEGRYLFVYKHEVAIVNFRKNELEKSTFVNPAIKSVTFKQGNLFLVRTNGILSKADSNADIHDLCSTNLPLNVRVHQVLCTGPDTFIISNSGIIGKKRQTFEEVPSAFSAAIDQKLFFVGTPADGLFIFDLSKKIRNKLIPEPEGIIDDARLYKGQLFVLRKRTDLSIYDSASNRKTDSIQVGMFHQLTPTLNFIRKDYFYSFCEDSSYRIPLKGTHRIPETVVDRYLHTTINQYSDIGSELLFKTRRYIYRLIPESLDRNRTIITIGHLGVGTEYESLFGFAVDQNNRPWYSTVKQVYQSDGNNSIPLNQFGTLAFREIAFSAKHLVGITQNNRLVVCHRYKEKNMRVDTLGESDCVWNKLIKINDSTLFITTNNYPRLLQFFSAGHKNNYRLRTLDNPFIPYQPDYLTSTDSGLMMFAQGEMFLFPANYLTEEKPRPSVHFTYLVSGSRKIPITDTVQLGFNEAQNLKILFQPISFFNTTLSYEYQINSGKNSGKWIPFQGEELNLIKLFFGSHLLKVRAKTQSGEYSPSADILLQVAKPWWADWWFLLLCFALLVTLISVIARRNIKRRLLKKENEVRFLISEYRSLNALMNPHFVFNSLNSLQSMVNNQETEPASRYIRIFSNLLRQNMHNMTHDLIPLTKEISLIENYLKLEKLRFKDKLNYSIEIDPDADLSDIKIPPLLIQPLVENAIKHGIWPMNSINARLTVTVAEEQEQICVRIRHNGAALGTAPKSDTNHESYAVENIRQRIAHLNRIHKLEIQYSIYNIEEQDTVTGVECTLRIPNFPDDITTDPRNSSV